MAVNINVPSQVKTYADLAAFPASGALKTIYIAEDTNKTYRWTGSVYVEVSAAGASGITIGTTAITSGTVGRVLFEGTGNVVQQSSSLFWDATNDRLTIGTSTGTSKINLPDAGTTASDGIAFGNGANIFKNASSGISLFSGSGTWQFNSAILVLPTNQATFIRMASGRNLLIDNGTTTFASINGTTGNVLIGTTTDAGFRLDVNGTARVGVLTCGNINPSSTTNVSGITFSAGTMDVSTNYDMRLIIPTSAKGAIVSQDYSFLSSASALFEVKSTTKGFLPPRMTTTQKNAIASPAAGLQVYDTTLTRPCFYDGTTWITL